MPPDGRPRPARSPPGPSRAGGDRAPRMSYSNTHHPLRDRPRRNRGCGSAPGSRIGRTVDRAVLSRGSWPRPSSGTGSPHSPGVWGLQRERGRRAAQRHCVHEHLHPCPRARTLGMHTDWLEPKNRPLLEHRPPFPPRNTSGAAAISHTACTFPTLFIQQLPSSYRSTQIPFDFRSAVFPDR